MSEKKKHILTIIIIVILIAGAIVGAVMHRKLTEFEYTDNLDETVVTIDDTSVTLRQFGYYIYEVEAFVQDQAVIYDADNPKKWWNTHFSAGLDSTYVCDYAKKVAVGTLICDEIYWSEAVGHGMSLNDAERAGIAEEAGEMYRGLDAHQRDVTGLDEIIIYEIKKKHALASKYAEYLAVTGDFKGYGGDPHDLLNWDGQYYQEVILPAHKINENQKILDNITLGTITVNY